jgi:Ni2+-binding GTPase involved in maturation of urease and hydrogenase
MNPEAAMVLLGNKSDLIDASDLKDREFNLAKLTENKTYPAILTSAKTGQGVEESFQRLAGSMEA